MGCLVSIIENTHLQVKRNRANKRILPPERLTLPEDSNFHSEYHRRRRLRYPWAIPLTAMNRESGGEWTWDDDARRIDSTIRVQQQQKRRSRGIS